MCAKRRATSLAERYDQAFLYQRHDHRPPDAPRPLPTSHWPAGNLEFLERYQDWLLSGGTSEMVTNTFHVMMAGHVLGLALKPYQQLDLDTDLDCALAYVEAKQLSATWTRNCRNSLLQFRRFLRLERGLGEETKARPFDVAAYTAGLPAWLVSEMERHQRLQQRNWRAARVDQNTRTFWSKNLLLWRFLCGQRGVGQLTDVQRQFVMEYIDQRLDGGCSVSVVNAELRCFHTFLLFLQDEGYAVPQSLLRIPGLKPPDALPKYLTDEQITLLRGEIERRVREASLPSRKRRALLLRAAFYLMWQSGLRLGEVEELRVRRMAA